MEKGKDKTIVKCVFVSSSQRDLSLYPTPSEFAIDLPNTINNIHSVAIRNFKFTPEALINYRNQTFSYTANSGVLTGNITVPVGDYTQNITTLLTEINNLLTTLQVRFTYNATLERIQFGFNGSFITNYIYIQNCEILNLLGFTNGIFLHRSSYTPTLSQSSVLYDQYNTNATAQNFITIINDTTMVLKIQDLETIHSADNATNRCTAILFSSRSSLSVAENTVHKPLPLLQKQSRIQRLRFNILNTRGLQYDLKYEGADFLIEFHCDEKDVFQQ
jgi:hypothetical protein